MGTGLNYSTDTCATLSPRAYSHVWLIIKSKDIIFYWDFHVLAATRVESSLWKWTMPEPPIVHHCTGGPLSGVPNWKFLWRPVCNLLVIITESIEELQKSSKNRCDVCLRCRRNSIPCGGCWVCVISGTLKPDPTSATSYPRMAAKSSPQSQDTIPESNVGWANVGPTSGRQYRRWPNVEPTYVAVWDVAWPNSTSSCSSSPPTISPSRPEDESTTHVLSGAPGSMHVKHGHSLIGPVSCAMQWRAKIR